MSKRFFTGFLFSVMLVVCMLRWTARADVVNHRIFRRNAPGAEFNLSVPEVGGNVLELRITPLTSGDYSCQFSLLSGDSEQPQYSSRGYYSYSEGKSVTASFNCRTPEAGEVLHYMASASFTPDGRYESIEESSNRYRTDNEGCGGDGCLSPHSGSEHLDVNMVDFTPANFSSSADVRVVNQVTYITIRGN
ncbi:MAG: hypothetical protein IJG65_04870 [Synergistaceae bacterium]|nr:hypothetical protein [Synergistaceae bacterium]